MKKITRLTTLTVLTSVLLSCCNSKDLQVYRNQQIIQQTTFRQIIESEGELVPVEKTTLQVPRRLWGTLEHLIPEGSIVKKGDVVARISTRQFTERVGRYLSNMEASQASMREKQLKLPLEKLQITEKEASKAHTAKIKALTEKQVKQGPREDERTRLAVEENKARLQAEAIPLDEKQQLQNQGYVSREEVAQTQQELLQQETLTQQARLKQIQQSNNYRQPDIEKARLETRGAELEQKIARLEGKARESLLRTQQLSARSRAASLGRRVKSIESRLDNSTLKAPFDGTVIYPRIWGDREPYIGMEVYNGLPIVQVARTDKLQVVSRVHEFDIPNIEVGQSVRMVSPGMPDQVLSGKIKKIQKLGKYKDESDPVGLKYFDVEIELEKEALSAAFRPHMQLNVSIESKEIPKAWTLPVEYVTTEKEKNYVFILQQGKLLKKEVQTLAQNAEHVALKGKWEGSEVFVLPEDAKSSGVSKDKPDA